MYKIVVTFTVFLLLFATYCHSITALTQDLGRHIKTGEIIVTTQHVPKTNLYSYTNPSFPFINHHWGSEVLFFASYQAAGFTGPFLLTLFASFTAFGLVFFYAYKRSDPLALALVSFLSLGILFERTDVRPEAFSFLLLSLFLSILFTNRKKPTKWLYALIPLQLLWVNLHIYFAIGILVLGLFLADTLITAFVKKQKFSDTKNVFLSPLFFVFIFSLLVCLLNPNGLEGALYPFRVFANYGYSIEENQNIFLLWELFQKRTIVFFCITVLLFFLTMSYRAKQTHPIGWLLGICFTILGVQTIRNFPLFVFAIFIPFTYHASALLSPLQKKPKLYLVLFTSVCLLLLWQLLFVLQTKPLSFTAPAGAAKGVTFLQRNTLKGPFFNNFDIGSYLIFRLYPKENVFVDGRPEAYPASFFKDIYIPMQQDPKIFAREDKKYMFNTIFFAHTDQTPWARQFLQDIVKNPKWHLVYLDDTVVIFTKDTSIKPLSLTTYKAPSSSTLSSLYSLFVFFQIIQQPQKQLETLQHIVQKDPTDCTALGLLSQAQTPLASVYQSRYRARCN